MKKVILSVIMGAAFVVGGVYQANARPDVRKMSCEQAKTMVRSQGAIVFTFTNNTYDRVVRNVNYCLHHIEETEKIFVKTRDTDRCNIGKRCITRIPKFEKW